MNPANKKYILLGLAILWLILATLGLFMEPDNYFNYGYLLVSVAFFYRYFTQPNQVEVE